MESVLWSMLHEFRTRSHIMVRVIGAAGGHSTSMLRLHTFRRLEA